MLDQFSRTQLLLGADNMDRLSNAKVAVFGIGGVGGLDGDSDLTLKDAPKNVPLCLVVGSEGFGISRLVKSNCDLIAKIPMFGRVNCLNASVATSIALFALKTQ